MYTSRLPNYLTLMHQDASRLDRHNDMFNYCSTQVSENQSALKKPQESGVHFPFFPHQIGKPGRATISDGERGGSKATIATLARRVREKNWTQFDSLFQFDLKATWLSLLLLTLSSTSFSSWKSVRNRFSGFDAFVFFCMWLGKSNWFGCPAG